MKDQSKNIKGYRELSQEEVALINRIKTVGEELGALIWDLRHEVRSVCVDSKWVNIAETHLQQGLMAATRAVAKPENF